MQPTAVSKDLRIADRMSEFTRLHKNLYTPLRQRDAYDLLIA